MTTTTPAAAQEEGAVLGKIGDRFEIRLLTTPQHLEWAAALAFMSNYFYSPLWTRIYSPDEATRQAYHVSAAVGPAMPSLLDCGLTLGVFDSQYKFKRAESAATGGKLYWDRTAVDKTRDQLEDEMDFPLVHTAFSFSAAKPPSEAQMQVLLAAMPLWGWFESEFAKANAGAGLVDVPPERVLKRCGTTTRGPYMGMGIMKACADFLIRRAADKGYRAIEIDATHGAVTKVWLNPPRPYTAKYVHALEPSAYRDHPGELEQQFAKSATGIERMHVFL